MSKLFERYQEENHGLNEVLQRIIDQEYEFECHLLDEWKNGERTPMNSTITEWEYLNKPTQ